MVKFIDQWNITLYTHVIAMMPETSIHINEKVTCSAATCVPPCTLPARAPAALPHSNQVVKCNYTAGRLCWKTWVDNGEKTLYDVDDQPTDTDETRSAAMSSSFPKSESTTSLLKSSSSARRPTHLPERTAESRRSQHHHQHQHQHHHRPAALQSSSNAEESFWSTECDISARRPLCHPSLIGSRDSDNATTRVKCKSHAPHSEVPDPPEPNGEAGRGVRERCRASKPTHRHHHRRKHNREDRPPPAGPPEPEHPRRCHTTHTRPVPRVPSLSDSTDDRAPLCEPRDRKGASSANSGGQVSSPSPSSCSLVPLSSRSSRRSRRSSATSFASDINLRTILNSLFGQGCLDFDLDMNQEMIYTQ
ncbi:protein doublesex-like [Thunnus albacares]|uniref:protein doublesex-like n=1 Tax=Thunnus albacares TaxID=8236 RepID=UPI001CF6DD1A|nr:protein doublesex-like [Thunnus albacares]